MVMSFAGDAHAFIGLRPEWTLEGAELAGDHALRFALEQSPFLWAHGVWEAEVLARPEGKLDSLPQRVLIRITPDTLRRWKEVGLNPFLEARAQLREHLSRKRPAGELSLLILL